MNFVQVRVHVITRVANIVINKHNKNMKLNKNTLLAKRFNKINMKEYNGITTLNAREVVDAFNSDPAIKKALDKLAE